MDEIGVASRRSSVFLVTNDWTVDSSRVDRLATG
jgi:hypothetical protein